MDFKKIQRAALEQGWTIKPVKKGLQYIPPDASRPIVTWHGTPSDVRALRNFLGEMRRSGLIWPWPRGLKKKGEDNTRWSGA